jgi:hypothetical protein
VLAKISRNLPDHLPVETAGSRTHIVGLAHPWASAAQSHCGTECNRLSLPHTHLYLITVLLPFIIFFIAVFYSADELYRKRQEEVATELSTILTVPFHSTRFGLCLHNNMLACSFPPPRCIHIRPKQITIPLLQMNLNYKISRTQNFVTTFSPSKSLLPEMLLACIRKVIGSNLGQSLTILTFFVGFFSPPRQLPQVRPRPAPIHSTIRRYTNSATNNVLNKP